MGWVADLVFALWLMFGVDAVIDRQVRSLRVPETPLRVPSSDILDGAPDTPFSPPPVH